MTGRLPTRYRGRPMVVGWEMAQKPLQTPDRMSVPIRSEPDELPASILAKIVTRFRGSAEFDNAERGRQQSMQEQREQIRVQALSEIAASMAAQILRDRHRNSWEHF